MALNIQIRHDTEMAQIMSQQPSPPNANPHPLRATILSILLVIGLYGLLFGMPFAVGFVLLILVHEMGHVIVLRWMGYSATAPVFIPFVGALISMKEQPKSAQAEAIVAYGGPLLGTVGAFIVYAAYYYTRLPFFLVLALLGFLINLFNMIPVSPMDGGRIATAISRWLWLPGLGLLVFLFFQLWNPLILVIAGLGAYRAYQQLFRPASLGNETDYFDVTPLGRFWMSIAYFGLILVLSYFVRLSYNQLTLLGHAGL
jgi:Zn-dependent protease